MIVEQWARGDLGPIPLPQFIREKAEVPSWFEIYWNAYWDLSGDRAGMGDGRILWTACHLWARAHGLSRRQEADLCYYVKAMDSEFLAFHAKRNA